MKSHAQTTTVAHVSSSGRTSQQNACAADSVRQASVMGNFMNIDGEAWYKITNSHAMPEFFLSIVSGSDHWMFLSSRGPITAGRKNPDSALFPYYSSDKIVDSSGCTGPRTLLRVLDGQGRWILWEPFSSNFVDDGQRSQNLYKNSFGNRVLFEEINHSLGLAFQYSWTSGERFGFIRNCELVNLNPAPVQVDITDGFENLIPAGLTSDFQLRYSNLADAYKKSELQSDSGLGLFYLSSIPTDRAEPSEGLRATVAWHHGLDNPTIALSSSQLNQVQLGKDLQRETSVRGKRSAYLVSKRVEIPSLQPLKWTLVADVNYDHCDTVNLHQHLLQHKDAGLADLAEELKQDAAANQSRLQRILSSADGCQVGNDQSKVWRHQSNVLFNVMRGGIPARGYEVDMADFRKHVQLFNRNAYRRNSEFLESITTPQSIDQLRQRIASTNDLDLIRIGSEYLPLCFSRRHGDPTRPWNKFSIDLRDEEGKEKLGYEGNWRDIFQNWEALAVSYPHFAHSMVLRFVNASTADGYNPYRITKVGLDWETLDPNDPWANIGYWGDHQIIYLLKLLECCRSMTPSRLSQSLSQQSCTYANVPYRIGSHEDICRNPQETIQFDQERADKIDIQVQQIGADGKLLLDENGHPHHVSLIEKLLVPALTKLTNFVPGGGIWLNTQRPEWNDANNALVGRGLSMVTTCHLSRYFTFLIDWLSSDDKDLPETVSISQQVWNLAERILGVIDQYADDLAGQVDDRTRRQILDGLSMAGTDFRQQLYDRGVAEEKDDVALSSLVEFFRRARTVIDHTIRLNRRSDGMYHSYNLMHLSDESASVTHLYEMLEGQVAVLSSSVLSSEEALEVLDALRQSRIYREDQQSYMLYPDRNLPEFLEKNRIANQSVQQSQLIQRLMAVGESSIVRQDILGDVHFNGDFRNASDLDAALDRIAGQSRYRDLVANERALLNEIFEETFGHRHFTGRSGTFFGYEGLGSIYWHMVSKLSLATMQQCVKIRESEGDLESLRLSELYRHYVNIRDGIGSAKSPAQYGAFPSDPYSHTPEDAGVKQPGMTGQVKEDILSRWDELGIRMREGQVRFDPVFFDEREFLHSGSSLHFYDVHDCETHLPVAAGCFAFTFCQVPIVYVRSDQSYLNVHFSDQLVIRREGLSLKPEETDAIFARNGKITHIEVFFSSHDQLSQNGDRAPLQKT